MAGRAANTGMAVIPSGYRIKEIVKNGKIENALVKTRSRNRMTKEKKMASERRRRSLKSVKIPVLTGALNGMIALDAAAAVKRQSGLLGSGGLNTYSGAIVSDLWNHSLSYYTGIELQTNGLSVIKPTITMDSIGKGLVGLGGNAIIHVLSSSKIGKSLNRKLARTHLPISFS